MDLYHLCFIWRTDFYCSLPVAKFWKCTFQVSNIYYGVVTAVIHNERVCVTLGIASYFINKFIEHFCIFFRCFHHSSFYWVLDIECYSFHLLNSSFALLEVSPMFLFQNRILFGLLLNFLMYLGIDYAPVTRSTLVNFFSWSSSG